MRSGGSAAFPAVSNNARRFLSSEAGLSGASGVAGPVPVGDPRAFNGEFVVRVMNCYRQSFYHEGYGAMYWYNVTQSPIHVSGYG